MERTGKPVRPAGHPIPRTILFIKHVINTLFFLRFVLAATRVSCFFGILNGTAGTASSCP